MLNWKWTVQFFPHTYVDTFTCTPSLVPAVSLNTVLFSRAPPAEDVSSLVLHLVLYQGEEEARQLQSAFEALVAKAEEKIMTIWPPERNVAMAMGSLQSVG